jgi:hypothetical protein
MNEGLQLLMLCTRSDEQQFGTTLALLRRCQGNTVSSVLENLQRSAEDNSTMARNVLSAYEQADLLLKGMAAGIRRQ